MKKECRGSLRDRGMLRTTRRVRRYSTLYLCILLLHIECLSLDVELYLHLLQPLLSAGMAIHGALVVSNEG